MLLKGSDPMESSLGALDVLQLVGLPADAAAGGNRIGDALAVLDLVQEGGQRGPRRTRGGRSFLQRNRGVARRRAAGVAARQLKLQMLAYNQSGAAKTEDHLLVVPGQRRVRVRGKGQWRRWTASATLKAAFASQQASLRQVGALLGSSASAAGCRDARFGVASIVMSSQASGVVRLVRQSQVAKLRYAIRNFMFDETRLCVGHRRHPVLAAHAQITWCDAGGRTFDADLVRPPELLRRASGPCMWSAVSSPTDICGLIPPVEQQPSAKLHGLLTATDSHSANKALLRHAESQLPETHLLLGSFCMQHQTGAVIEAITSLLRLRGPSYCFCATFARGDFVADLRERVHRAITRDLLLTSEQEARPTDIAATSSFVSMCFAEAAEAAAPGTQPRRQQLAEDFARFFPGPWTGALICLLRCAVVNVVLLVAEHLHGWASPGNPRHTTAPQVPASPSGQCGS